MKKGKLEFSHKDFETLSRSLSEFWEKAFVWGLESKAYTYVKGNSDGNAMTGVFAYLGNKHCDCKWSEYDHHAGIPFLLEDELRVDDPHMVYEILSDMEDWCRDNGHEILTIAFIYKTRKEVVGLKFRTQTDDWFWEHTYTL